MNTDPNKLKHRCIGALILVCVLVLGSIGIYYGVDTGFFERAYYELQSQITGEIRFELGTYSGETDFGIMSGIGGFQFDSGEYYHGDWVDDRIEGYGTINHPETGQYVGDFIDSQKNGNGTFTWSNGDQYVGTWLNDEMSGLGIYTFADGSVLDGAFEGNCFKNGSYTFENESGNYIINYVSGNMDSAEIVFSDGTSYSGECADGQISGYGEMIYPNGDTYKGYYFGGKRNGTGKYTWSIGDSYDGEWNTDEMSGTGRYIFNTGEKLYGAFANNSFVSGTYETTTEMGNYIFALEYGVPIGLEMELENGLCYDGGFSNNKLNGRGTLTYPSGDQYVGDFVDGVRCGAGTYTWKSGAYYSGTWANDLMNGRGTYYYSDDSDGYKLVGNFVDNAPDGECTYYVSSSLSYGTTWRDGRCVKVTE